MTTDELENIANNVLAEQGQQGEVGSIIDPDSNEILGYALFFSCNTVHPKIQTGFYSDITSNVDDAHRDIYRKVINCFSDRLTEQRQIRYG